MMPIQGLMVGTGEYTTGYVNGLAADSDKGAGVVALTLFDLRRRGLVGDLKMAGTNGTKFPGIRQHIGRVIGDAYRDLDTRFESYPADHVTSDAFAYRAALDTLSPGDVVIVFTPDDTHFSIAMDAIERHCHVLIAKPLVKTLEEHLVLLRAAEEQGVLVAMDVHKRWDPIYADARDRIRELGDFSLFSSYMSQPKSQLNTFRAWAGKASDISYYLNAHHVDFHAWAVSHMALPRRVYASASTGCARRAGMDTEDAITLMVTWENVESGNLGTAVYGASWIAPKSDAHSQQRFFYMGHDGELTVDQAHRGYSLAAHDRGLASPNPLFMKYAPDSRGRFVGQNGYGYRSIEAFILAAAEIRDGNARASDFAGKLAMVQETSLVTAILEAGRRSLDRGGRVYEILYDESGSVAGMR